MKILKKSWVLNHRRTKFLRASLFYSINRYSSQSPYSPRRSASKPRCCQVNLALHVASKREGILPDKRVPLPTIADATDPMGHFAKMAAVR